MHLVGILAAVLHVLCGGTDIAGEGVGGGLQSSPSPSHHTVGTQGWILVGRGGGHSYITFDPSLTSPQVTSTHFFPRGT